MNKRLTKRLLPLMLSSLFAVSGAYAQSTSAGLGGVVTDSQGQPATGHPILHHHKRHKSQGFRLVRLLNPRKQD